MPKKTYVPWFADSGILGRRTDKPVYYGVVIIGSFLQDGGGGNVGNYKHGAAHRYAKRVRYGRSDLQTNFTPLKMI